MQNRQNRQVFLSYTIVVTLGLVFFSLFNLSISTVQTNAYTPLELLLTQGFAALLIALIVFDYLTTLPLKSFTPLLGLAVGGLFFINIIGLQVVDPSQITWLMKGDLTQNYLGWQFFRQEDWQQPWGAIGQFYHPVGTSIVYTDSLPLLALPLKLVSDYLPADFQYIGAWVFTNYLLQGVFAGLLMRLLTPSLSIQVLGIAFFVWSPVLISRVDHYSLTTHWLLLAGLWLYFKTWTHPTAFSAFGIWLLLVIVSALVHPYLAIMVWALMAAFYMRWWLVEGHSGFFSTGFQIAILFAVTLGCWWISGVFVISGEQSLHTQGLGYYSMNLLAPINSMDFSTLLKSFPVATKGQLEGFNYFGIGVWILVLWAIYELARQSSSRTIAVWPLISVCIVLTLFALSPKITFLQWTLFELQGEWLKYFAPFRSSGRFFWVVGYTILFLALSMIITRHTKRAAFFLLAFAFIIQVIDLYPLQNRVTQLAKAAHNQWDNPLKSPQWEELAQDRQHIVLIPPADCGVAAAPYLPISYFAMKHHMSINTGHVARIDTEKSTEYCQRLQHIIDEGQVNEDSLYIVNPDYLEAFQQKASTALRCQHLDELWACVTTDDSIRAESTDEMEKIIEPATTDEMITSTDNATQTPTTETAETVDATVTRDETGNATNVDQPDDITVITE